MKKINNNTTTFAGRICFMMLALLFTLPTLASESEMGNTEVSGVVVDKKTKDPLIGVNVAIWKGTEMVTGVITDFNGAFHTTTSQTDLTYESLIWATRS